MSDNSILIRKIHMNCPICDQIHEVEERKRSASTVIKGDLVTYEEHYFYCENADLDECEFESASMTNRNLLNARNAYRVKHGLLTSDEIVAIRESYGISQVELAKLLGWGEATISRYESKAIQDEAYDAMLRIVRDNPLKALELLKRHSSRFSAERQIIIRSRIKEKLDTYGKEFLSRQTLESDYIGYMEPSDSNGYAVLDIDKIEAIVSYYAEKVSYLFKVKLMKLLWYTDALSFQWYGKAMTGLVYRHDMMGALPVGHRNLVNLEKLNVREESSGAYDTMLHFYPDRQQDYSVLTLNDRIVLDAVIEKFKDARAKEIVDYMHEERAYKETSPDAIIPLCLAKEIRPFK